MRTSAWATSRTLRVTRVQSRARAVAHFDERTVVARVLDTYAAVARRKGLAWPLADPPPPGD